MVLYLILLVFRINCHSLLRVFLLAYSSLLWWSYFLSRILMLLEQSVFFNRHEPKQLGKKALHGNAHIPAAD